MLIAAQARLSGSRRHPEHPADGILNVAINYGADACMPFKVTRRALHVSSCRSAPDAGEVSR